LFLKINPETIKAQMKGWVESWREEAFDIWRKTLLVKVSLDSEEIKMVLNPKIKNLMKK
jgi:aspartyl/asparaginyl beta-hydroxylase (cupin superfamily)